jgi:hypothetical protein
MLQVRSSIQGRRVLNWLAASKRDTYEVKVIPTQSREPHVVQGRQIVFHALFTEKRKDNNSDSDMRLKKFKQKHSPYLSPLPCVTY